MNTVLFTKVSRLHKAIVNLQPSTKKALYAAGMGNVFNRSTWNGCALKASGGEVSSFQQAAAFFNEPVENMQFFVSAWDKFPRVNKEYGTPAEITQEQQTLYLIDVLEQVGLDTTPLEASAKKFTFTINVKNGKSESELDEFLTSLDQPVVETVCEASELLFANA